MNWLWNIGNWNKNGEQKNNHLEILQEKALNEIKENHQNTLQKEPRNPPEITTNNEELQIRPVLKIESLFFNETEININNNNVNNNQNSINTSVSKNILLLNEIREENSKSILSDPMVINLEEEKSLTKKLLHQLEDKKVKSENEKFFNDQVEENLVEKMKKDMELEEERKRREREIIQQKEKEAFLLKQEELLEKFLKEKKLKIEKN